MQYLYAGQFDRVTVILAHLEAQLTAIVSAFNAELNEDDDYEAASKRTLLIKCLSLPPIDKLIAKHSPKSDPAPAPSPAPSFVTSAASSLFSPPPQTSSLFAPSASSSLFAPSSTDLFFNPTPSFDDQSNSEEKEKEVAAEQPAEQQPERPKNDAIHFGKEQADRLIDYLTNYSIPSLLPADQPHLIAVIRATQKLEEIKYGVDELGLKFLLSFHFSSFLSSPPPSSSSSSSPSLYSPSPSSPSSSIETVKLKARDFAWAMHTEGMDNLVNSCVPEETTWNQAKGLGIGFWLLSSPPTLKRIVEQIAKAQYLLKKNPEDCAVFYIALGKKDALARLYKLANNPRLSDFLGNDFNQKQWQTAALKNAYALLGKKNYEYAVSFFLLANDLKGAIAICIKHLNDFNLPLILCALLEGEYSSNLKILLEETIIPYSQQRGDVWLQSIAYWLLRKYDLSLQSLIPLQDDFEREIGEEGDEKSEKASEKSLGGASSVDSIASLKKSKQMAQFDPSVVYYYQFLSSRPLVRSKPSAENELQMIKKAALTYSSLGIPNLALELIGRIKELEKQVEKEEEERKKEEEGGGFMGFGPGFGAPPPQSSAASSLFAPSAASSLFDTPSNEFSFGGSMDFSSSLSFGSTTQSFDSGSSFGGGFGGGFDSGPSFGGSSFGGGFGGLGSMIITTEDDPPAPSDDAKKEEEAEDQPPEEGETAHSLLKRTTNQIFIDNLIFDLATKWVLIEEEESEQSIRKLEEVLKYIREIVGAENIRVQQIARRITFFCSKLHKTYLEFLLLLFPPSFPSPAEEQPPEADDPTPSLSPSSPSPTENSTEEEHTGGEVNPAGDGSEEEQPPEGEGEVESKAVSKSEAIPNLSHSLLPPPAPAPIEVAVSPELLRRIDHFFDRKIKQISTIIQSFLSSEKPYQLSSLQLKFLLSQLLQYLKCLQLIDLKCIDLSVEKRAMVVNAIQLMVIVCAWSARHYSLLLTVLSSSDQQFLALPLPSLCSSLLSSLSFSTRNGHLQSEFGFAHKHKEADRFLIRLLRLFITHQLRSSPLCESLFTRSHLYSLDPFAQQSMMIGYSQLESDTYFTPFLTSSSSDAPLSDILKVHKSQHVLNELIRVSSMQSEECVALWNYYAKRSGKEILGTPAFAKKIIRENPSKPSCKFLPPVSVEESRDMILSFCVHPVIKSHYVIANSKGIFEISRHKPILDRPSSPSISGGSGKAISMPALTDHNGAHPPPFTPPSPSNLSSANLSSSRNLSSSNSKPSTRSLPLRNSTPVTHLESHPTAPYYLSGGANGAVYLWLYQHKEAIIAYKQPGGAKISKIHFNNTGSKFGYCDYSGTLYLHRFNTDPDSPFKPYITLAANSKRTNDFTFCNGGSIVATTGLSDNALNNNSLFDTLLPPHKSLIASYKAHEASGGQSIIYSPSIQSLISGGKKGDLCIYDIRQRKIREKEMKIHEGNIQCMATDPLDQIFITGSTDGNMRIFDINTLKCLETYVNIHKKMSFVRPEMILSSSTPVFSKGVMHTMINNNNVIYSCGADGHLVENLIVR